MFLVILFLLIPALALSMENQNFNDRVSTPLMLFLDCMEEEACANAKKLEVKLKEIENKKEEYAQKDINIKKKYTIKILKYLDLYSLSEAEYDFFRRPNFDPKYLNAGEISALIMTNYKFFIPFIIQKFRKEKKQSFDFFSAVNFCQNDDDYRATLYRAFEINFPHLYKNPEYRDVFTIKKIL